MLIRSWILAALALLVSTGLHATSIEGIPSPRPQGWVSDLTGTLDASATARINRLADALHRHEGAEMAVVVISSTDGRDARVFATDLFNHWGIGDPVRNNGVLVFAALDDRAAEIILGEGIDDAPQVAAVERIMQQVMVPHFRRGNARAALVDGAEAVAKSLFGVPAQTTAPAPVRRTESRPQPALEVEAPSRPAPAAVPPTTSAPAPSTDESKSAPTSQPAFLPWLIAGAIGWLVIKAARKRPALARRDGERCERCGSEMARADEAREQAHLSAQERTEERLGSVDYSVYACTACSHVEKRRHGSPFNSYTACPVCKTVALRSDQRTIRAATEDEEGLVRSEEHCLHCNYRNARELHTPRLRGSAVDAADNPRGLSVLAGMLGSGLGRRSSGGSSSRSSGFGGGRSAGRGASRSPKGGSSGRW